MIRNASACLAGAVLLAMTAPLSAHHAVTAEFDQNKPDHVHRHHQGRRVGEPAHLYPGRSQGAGRQDGRVPGGRRRAQFLVPPGLEAGHAQARRCRHGQRYSLQERHLDQHRPGDHHDSRRQEARRSWCRERRGAAAAAVEPVGTKATTSVGIGDWGLGIGEDNTPQVFLIPNPNPQSLRLDLVLTEREVEATGDAELRRRRAGQDTRHAVKAQTSRSAEHERVA